MLFLTFQCCRLSYSSSFYFFMYVLACYYYTELNYKNAEICNDPFITTLFVKQESYCYSLSVFKCLTYYHAAILFSLAYSEYRLKKYPLYFSYCDMTLYQNGFIKIKINYPVGTWYCSGIGFLLDLHRDIDQLHIEIEVTSLSFSNITTMF